MKLTTDEIKHVANLARLELSEQEGELYGDQLSDVLSYIDQLREVDVRGVEPTAQVTGLVNVLREDKIIEWNEDEVSETLDESPELENGQVKVKRIL
jgi:aspartyl-tRNA(Asn)/glutamyl-tRNA(Gln) amidotransferase subunit C